MKKNTKLGGLGCAVFPKSIHLTFSLVTFFYDSSACSWIDTWSLLQKEQAREEPWRGVRLLQQKLHTSAYFSALEHSNSKITN